MIKSTIRKIMDDVQTISYAQLENRLEKYSEISFDIHILNIVTVITVMKPTRVQTLFLYLQRMKKKLRQESLRQTGLQS